jgi:hypothetical protein
MEVPPFVPVAEQTPAPVIEPMVVMTVRISPRKKDAIKLLFRKDPDINSVSHVVQLAIDEYLAKHG